VWATFNSPAAMNDALRPLRRHRLRRVPACWTIGRARKARPNAVKGVTAFRQADPVNTRNPNIKSIADYPRRKDRRAGREGLGAGDDVADGGGEAVGQANFAKLDPLTSGVAAHATIALLSDAPRSPACSACRPSSSQQL